jgi:hypothetical protein
VPNRDEYRRRAKACVAQAELLLDPQDRAAVLTIAQTYLKLADRIGARYERGTAHRDPGDRHAVNDS